MLKLSLFTVPLAALLAFKTVPAHADSLSCVTVNGQTKCAHGTNSTSCTAVGDRIICRGDSDMRAPHPPQQIAPDGAPPKGEDQPDTAEPDDDEDTPPLLLPPDRRSVRR